jgi:hypothetical protein
VSEGEDDPAGVCELDESVFDSFYPDAGATLDRLLGRDIDVWQFIRLLRRREPSGPGGPRLDAIAGSVPLSLADTETRRDGPKAALLMAIGSALLLVGGLGHRLRRRSQRARLRRW